MSRDLRKYGLQTNRRLLLGFIILLLLIGDGLIYMIYGPGAAVSGLICLLSGLSPLFLIWVVLIVIERIANKANQ